jgi:hypothetical protein
VESDKCFVLNAAEEKAGWGLEDLVIGTSGDRKGKTYRSLPLINTHNTDPQRSGHLRSVWRKVNPGVDSVSPLKS